MNPPTQTMVEKEMIVSPKDSEKEKGFDIFAKIELLIKKIQDKEILKLSNEIIKQITLGFKNTENPFIKNSAPKLLSKILENYVVYSMSANKEENRQNTVKQLYLLLKNIINHLKNSANTQ